MDIEALMKDIAAPNPWTFPGKEQVWHMSRSQIARLAGLVAEREREACAKAVIARAAKVGHRALPVSVGEACACAIRMRSNVELTGAAPHGQKTKLQEIEK